jgi:hypothetical protein
MNLLTIASNAPEALLCGLWLWSVTKQVSLGVFLTGSEAFLQQVIPYIKYLVLLNIQLFVYIFSLTLK